MRSRHNLFMAPLIVVWLTSAPWPPRCGRSTVQHAMIASAHELASRAGVEIMKAGGNAVDAAVATGFALAVVFPQAGNLGGGGFMLIRTADGTAHFIDYREKAPAAATANMYLDAQGNVIENASLLGYKAIGVPGSVAGLATRRKSTANSPLAQVMAPAIKLAREGFALAWEDAKDLRDERPRDSFRNRNAFFSATATSTGPERFSASRSWLARWSGSPRIPTTSITARWPANLPPAFKKAAA